MGFLIEDSAITVIIRQNVATPQITASQNVILSTKAIPITVPIEPTSAIRTFLSFMASVPECGICALRRAVYHYLIAEQANLGVVQDIDGFVFAQPARESLSEFGFADGESRRVGIVYVGRPDFGAARAVSPPGPDLNRRERKEQRF